MSENLPILSIRQPWAHLILHHGKDIENRTWPTRVRGRILIHAGKAWDIHPHTWESSWPEFDVIDTPVEEIPLGGIVGSVEIADCVTESDSDWFFGPYGFVLRDPVVLPFEPMRGQLGFFRRKS